MAATSQLAENLRTVLEQMADAARGERIRALREARPDLTEPKIVEAINRLGGPGTITVRGYQYWEATGGIKYEKAILLAEVFGADPVWLFFGPKGKPATPQLMESLDGASGTENEMDLLGRLNQIDAKLDLLLGATQPQGEPPADGSDVDAGQQLDPDSQQEPPGEDEPESGEEGR